MQTPKRQNPACVRRSCQVLCWHRSTGANARRDILSLHLIPFWLPRSGAWPSLQPPPGTSPGEAIDDVAVLANQHCATVVIDRCDANAGCCHPDTVVHARKTGPVCDGIAPYRKIGTRELFFFPMNGPRIGSILSHVLRSFGPQLLHANQSPSASQEPIFGRLVRPTCGSSS